MFAIIAGIGKNVSNFVTWSCERHHHQVMWENLVKVIAAKVVWEIPVKDIAITKSWEKFLWKTSPSPSPNHERNHTGQKKLAYADMGRKCVKRGLPSIGLDQV